MGKGTIVSNLGNGQYTLTINKSRAYFDRLIAGYEAKIAALEQKLYHELEPGSDSYNAAKLSLASVNKAKSAVERLVPSDETISAWCADLSENLTGVVATVEVPGEATSVQIRPGFVTAAWGSAYGTLVPALGQTAEGMFYNLCMFPGWQKWRPTFRYGTISNINAALNTCTVTLLSAHSSQQNINVNPQEYETLNNVPIKYMQCDAGAFQNGDTVLVEFLGQTWESPKVIGFKDHPRACGEYIYITSYMPGAGSSSMRCIVWDTGTDSYASVSKNDGTPATFPCAPSLISTWLSKRKSLGKELILIDTTEEPLGCSGGLSCACPPSGWDPTKSYSGNCSADKSCVGTTLTSVDTDGSAADYSYSYLGNYWLSCNYIPYYLSYHQLTVESIGQYSIERVKLKNNSKYMSYYGYKLDNSNIRLGTIFSKELERSNDYEKHYVTSSFVEYKGDFDASYIWNRRAWNDLDGFDIDCTIEDKVSYQAPGSYKFTNHIKAVMTDAGRARYEVNMDILYYEWNAVFSENTILSFSAQKIVYVNLEETESGSSSTYDESMPFRVRCYTFYGTPADKLPGAYCPTDGVNPVEVSERNTALEAAIVAMREAILAAGGEAYKGYSTDIIFNSYILK